MPKDPPGLYEDMIVIPFEIPWSIDGGADAESEGQRPANRGADATASVLPPAGARGTIKPEGVGWPPPESRLIGINVRDYPNLAVSGASDGELTLWRRSTDTAPAAPLASFRLHPDGSELFAGEKFVGLLYEDEGAARLHPDWLRSIGAGQAKSDNDFSETPGAPVSNRPQAGDPEHSLRPAAAAVSTLGRDAVRPVPFGPFEALALVAAAIVAGEGVAAGLISLARIVARRSISRKIAGRRIEALAESGKRLDPADKGRQLTRAGRALQKHGGRPGSAFPPARGNPAQVNQEGQGVLEQILNDPHSSVKLGNEFGGFDVFAGNGRGARFDANAVFRGFLEP